MQRPKVFRQNEVSLYKRYMPDVPCRLCQPSAISGTEVRGSLGDSRYVPLLELFIPLQTWGRGVYKLDILHPRLTGLRHL